MTYEPVIGLEIHAQLLTASKIFCGCSTAFGAAPNTHVCPVCLGLPGALPVLNRRAVDCAVRAALALDCTIQRDVDLRAEELLLSRSAQGLSDFPVRAAARRERRDSRGQRLLEPRLRHPHHARPHGRRRGQAAARGVSRFRPEELRRSQPRRHAAHRDRDGAGFARRVGAEGRRGVFRLPPGAARRPSASTTGTWKRAASGATRTSRSGRPGRQTLGTRSGNQEPQLVPVCRGGDYLRDRAADRRDSRPASGSCRRRGSGIRPRSAPCRCAARRKRTTTGTFRNPICRRSSSTPRASGTCVETLPELPAVRRQRLMARTP